jgi:small subunit ribosomal protein S17
MPKKVLQGIVVKAKKMDKTITVEVTDMVIHKKYHKSVKSTKRYHVHDELNACIEGQTVTFIESKPISKSKTWTLMQNEQSQN